MPRKASYFSILRIISKKNNYFVLLRQIYQRVVRRRGLCMDGIGQWVLGVKILQLFA